MQKIIWSCVVLWGIALGVAHDWSDPDFRQLFTAAIGDKIAAALDGSAHAKEVPGRIDYVDRAPEVPAELEVTWLEPKAPAVALAAEPHAPLRYAYAADDPDSSLFPAMALPLLAPIPHPWIQVSVPELDKYTAVYDIKASIVYMPDGTLLEAHSGVGKLRDNPDDVRFKDLGPTPPNVYNLTLREELFHGVEAIRLNPVNEKKMYGRDGILAHSYMLDKTKGQSNGCVSFKNYDLFLQAFKRGEVKRLVVMAHT